jgi:hypothetical protein
MTAVADCRRVQGQLPQRRASTGRAKPSRLALHAMERGSVGQTFLSALVDVRRQECPRHIGQHLSMAIDPVATCRSCRYPSAVPVVPAGSAVPGLEDEDEDEDENENENEKAPRSPPPGCAGSFSLRRTSVSGDSTKRSDKVWGRSVADKAWRQSVETRCKREAHT